MIAKRMLQSRRGRVAAALLLALGAGSAGAAGAQAAPFSLQPVAGSFTEPANAASAPGDGHRLFVTERPGRVRVVRDDQVLPTPFLDITGEVSERAGSEQGLMSIAFAPDYATSRRFYVFFSDVPNGDVRIREYRRSASDPDRADPASGRDVLRVVHSVPSMTEDQKTVYAKHYGGQLVFGPDGLLYIAMGDGGDGDDQDANAQDLGSLKGKILRIDPGDPDGPGPATYRVPADNPYVGRAGADEIWMSGLRNPYRFSFDRVTGDMMIGDVGGTQYEELDVALAGPGGAVGGAGYNFGWKLCEGFFQRDSPAVSCPPQYRAPLLVRSHAVHGARAITAGVVVRDPGLPSLVGRAIYTEDAFEGVVRSARLSGPGAPEDRLEGDIPSLVPGGITAFTEDACGRVYFVRLFAPPGQQLVRLQEGATATSCGAPAVVLQSAPSGVTTAREATVAWTIEDEPATLVECSGDGGAWAACSSPAALSNLGDGPHSFQVRARDAAGNVSPPVRADWTVVSPPPPVGGAGRPGGAAGAGDAAALAALARAAGSWGRVTAVSLLLPKSRAVAVTRRGKGFAAALRIRNANAFTATGSLTVTGVTRGAGRGLRLGTASKLRLAGKRTVSVRFAVGMRLRRLLRDHGPLKAKVRLVLRDTGGKQRVVSATVTIRPLKAAGKRR